MFPDTNELKARKRDDIISGIGVLLILSCLSYLLFATSRYEMQWSVIWDYRGSLIRGWLVTLGVAAVALVLSTCVGILILLGRYSKFSPVRGSVIILIELARGMPLIVLILIGYHVVAPPMNIDNRFFIGVGILSVFSGAYLGEIFRGGIESVPRSQWEAARAVGFDKTQTVRFVVVPQAMRRVLPAVAGQFANLVKDSALLYVIGTPEVTYEARQIMAATYSNLEAYSILALAYLVITLPIFWYSRRLERQFSFVS